MPTELFPKSGPIVIVGAGPAGLTAALELQRAGFSDITILEATSAIGGISRTHNHHGNRIDIGGHRFFSKSDWVMKWWTNILPVAFSENQSADSILLRHQGQERQGLSPGVFANPPSEAEENVMLVRNRLSRIYFNRQFFDYPLKLNFSSLAKLGVFKTATFGISYLAAKIRPRPAEKTLEDFLVNRFGQRLYRQFFKEYTEKVWGVPCNQISADWGAQRIKSLSITKAVTHALRSMIGADSGKVRQTSLIESFLYPKYGPGQMWEMAADKFVEQGGKLLLERRCESIHISSGVVTKAVAKDLAGRTAHLPCTAFISTMPIKELVAATDSGFSNSAREIASELQYRDFLTVGLLYKKSQMRTELKDNWIYIQEPGVNVGRVQVFNNWSPYMVRGDDTIWLGLEFFCIETDPLWKMSDTDLINLAQKEMKQIALIQGEAAIDAVVLKVPKAYPGYFGKAYENFGKLRDELDAVSNMFLIGRNGMHRYNNQDHSMLTAKEAAAQISKGEVEKSRIWAVNVGDDYHEEK